MSKKVKTFELFSVKNEYIKSLFEETEYPWEILPKINEYIMALIKNGIDGFSEISKNVYVGKNVIVSPLATICGPAIIGNGTEIRPGAYIRGNVICGENCVIGNSTELKNCVLLDNSAVPHYNYVGDSVLGNGSHMGAGAICSNLKADKKNVIICSDEKIETGLKKVGAFLGDGADIGCGSVLNPGTVIGKNTSVYPLTSVRGVIGENMIVKTLENIVNRV